MTESYESQHVADPHDDGGALPRIAMLGVGSMGGAILAGLRAPGTRVARPVTVTTRSRASAEALAGDTDVIVLAGETEPAANRIAVRGARLVVLAVKPWLIHEVLREISGELEPDAIVISVAAGVTTASMEALLPEGIAVVRAMPNTPANVGLGVTGIAGGARAGTEAIELARSLFATVGDVLVVTEAQINAVAAVSGSGPAYLFWFAEQLTAAAQRLGFDEDQARVLAQGTLVGAAELMRATGEDPAELRRKVTSPKGTTEQAILVLQGAGWDVALDAALAANIRRSEEIEAAARE